MARRALFLFVSDRMGGAEQLTRALAKEAALSGKFDQVECFVLFLSRTGTLDELEELPGVSVRYTEKASQIAGLLPCLAFLMRGRFDLVFSSQVTLNLFCSLLRYLRVLSSRRLVTRESTMIFERNFGWRTGLVRLAYSVYGASDLVICQTDRMLGSLGAHTSRRVRMKSVVLPNPIDLSRVSSDARQEPPPEFLAVPAARKMIVWCGRMVPVKGPLRALETLQVLHRMGHADAHLVMVGDGHLMDEVKRVAKELHMLDFVTLAGYVGKPASIMAKCDIGLVTSEVEGFPNVVLEMLAAGVPVVVATNCAGGLADMPGVRVSTQGEANELAAILAGALQEPPDRAIAAFLASRTFHNYFREIMLC